MSLSQGTLSVHRRESVFEYQTLQWRACYWLRSETPLLRPISQDNSPCFEHNLKFSTVTWLCVSGQMVIIHQRPMFIFSIFIQREQSSQLVPKCSSKLQSHAASRQEAQEIGLSFIVTFGAKSHSQQMVCRKSKNGKAMVFNHVNKERLCLQPP